VIVLKLLRKRSNRYVQYILVHHHHYPQCQGAAADHNVLVAQGQRPSHPPDLPITCLRFAPSLANIDGPQLLQAVTSQLIPFIRSSTPIRVGGANHLVDPVALDPQVLSKLLREDVTMPDEGQGQGGLLKMLEKVLKYSVNTWNEGFMDKLYASTNAVSNHLQEGSNGGRRMTRKVGRNRVVWC